MRGIFVVLATLWLSPVSLADVDSAAIRDFNSALQSGTTEAQVAAARVLSNEVIANPNDKNAALMGFEAGWLLCRHADCQGAQPVAELIASLPIKDATQHPVPTDRNLLLAYVGWKNSVSRKSRSALDSALDAVQEAEPSMISMAAFNARYQYDQTKKRHRRATATAKAAKEHLTPIQDLVPLDVAMATFAQAANSWRDEPNADAQRLMHHAEGQFRVALSSDDYRGSANTTTMRWRARAWTLMMEAYMESLRPEGGFSNIKRRPDIMKPSEGDEIDAFYDQKVEPYRAEGQPFCGGRLSDEIDIIYPNVAETGGVVGAIVLGFDVENGVKTNERILAGVSGTPFYKAAIRALKKLEWVPIEVNGNNSCSNSAEGLSR